MKIFLKDKSGKYIRIIKFGATQVNTPNKNNISFDKKFLKQSINYFVGQRFFNVGNLKFHQTIGIPVGCDPVLFKANLFLFIFGCKWALQTKTFKLQKAKKIANIFYFINDLSATNDKSGIEKKFKETHLQE